MRLRYLHLPRYGPLIDTAIVFGREDFITDTLDWTRKGTLNFLVGVNGSGKSSVLRAIYSAFASLQRREEPSFPLTLAWDRKRGEETKTVLVHFPGRNGEPPFFAVFRPLPADMKRHEWEAKIAELRRLDSSHSTVDMPFVKDQEAFSDGRLFAHLPKRMIAYTTGGADPWMQMEHRVFQPPDMEEELYLAGDERPRGWDMSREWDAEQGIRIAGLEELAASKSSEIPQLLREELSLLGNVRQKLATNRMPDPESRDPFYFRMTRRHMRLAGVILGLWQAARELSGRHEERRREDLHKLFLRQQGSQSKPEAPGDTPEDARRVLNEIDWFWPTHLSLTYTADEDRTDSRQANELLCLAALADEVIAQPGGRMRAVFSLGPSERISLSEMLEDALPAAALGSHIEQIKNGVDASQTLAEAVLRVFSPDTDKDLDAAPMDVFTRLCDWERTGLLEDITLTIKRLHRSNAYDGEEDDIIVTYDQLSDGEQMLLCRMGLLFLLRGQDGSLLLLDEPETHFNDVWKREIVEMADISLLKSTQANILISTHTSIALTDAFASEVTVLDKREGGITARRVTGGLFGTDPSEVAMSLFHAESSTGRRSDEILDRLLGLEWKGREDELEKVLSFLGSSFHRAELRALLKQLRADMMEKDGPASR